MDCQRRTWTASRLSFFVPMLLIGLSCGGHGSGIRAAQPSASAHHSEGPSGNALDSERAQPLQGASSGDSGEDVSADLQALAGSEELQPPVVRDGQPLILWEVRENGQLKAYLHGSVHVLPGAHLGQEPQIDQAFADSDALVVEVDISTSNSALSLLTAQLGMYPTGDSLDDDLDDELLQQAKARAGQYGLPVAAALRMRPWLLAVTLTMLSMAQEGFSQEYGVDRRFLAEAHGRGGSPKPVMALETAEEQLRLFADLPTEQQVMFLRDVLLRSDDHDELRDILQAWASGNVAALEEHLFAPLRQDPSLEPLYETFYFKRNRAMSGRLVGLFVEPRVYFVVVGAAHLVGDESIVSLLQERGYQVEQVYVKTEEDGTGAHPPLPDASTPGPAPEAGNGAGAVGLHAAPGAAP